MPAVLPFSMILVLLRLDMLLAEELKSLPLRFLEFFMMDALPALSSSTLRVGTCSYRDLTSYTQSCL